MGCSGSKVEQQKAVALCRGRADLLAAAIHHRDAFASAHAAYSDSLLSVSAALHRLLVPPDSFPVLPLTARRKSEPSPPPTFASSARHSDIGSHINFLPSDSDSDSDSGDNENENDNVDDNVNDNGYCSSFHYSGSSPVHHLDHYRTSQLGPVSGGDIYYARSKPPPSVTLAQTSQRYETVQVGSFDPYQDHPSFGDPYSYFPNNYGSMGGFFGLSSSLPVMPPPSSMAASASSSGRFLSTKAPPPPPSPPRTSTWDFFNPFQVYDDYYSRYPPNWSSREVRYEEGIPDLEEVDQEVVKEVAFSSTADREKRSAMGASARREDEMNSVREGSAASRDTNHKQEAIDKNGVQMLPAEALNAAFPKKIADFSVAAGEIKAQFERAYQGTGELTKLLEVGNLRHYHLKHSLYEASSRVIGAMISSSPNSGFLEFDGDKGMGSRSLASTLQKLHIWERKLYHEVRDEEKMRLLLSRSHKELKRMTEKGAEAAKIDSMRNLIKKLSTKIRIAIKVVDSVSKKINRLRDEELYPRITELVLGMVRMWNTMLECQEMQCQAISEFKGLDSVFSGQTIGIIDSDRIMQLEYELLKWTSNFSAWINAQRNYVKALNGWLTLCLHYEPEETADGVAPYSPRRMGAPPVFIICNSWSQAMDKTSERGVLESMESLAEAVRRLWEQQNIEQHERLIAVRVMDRWTQAMEKHKRHVQKEVDSLNKKLALVPGQSRLRDYPRSLEGYTIEASSIQLGLERIFNAIHGYTDSSAKAYQLLLEQCEEEAQVARCSVKNLGGNQEGSKRK